MHAVLATMALMAASASALGVGQAVVVNTCNYDVYLANTPSNDGVHTTTSMTMQPNDTYNQTWTELTNGAGWSIKLSKSATEWTSNIMQYEYTFHDDGIIWYDLSDVDGNPWDADWEITATSPSSTCSPLQQAYRYATDDAYGMQACPQDAVITVTLCSGEDQNDGAAGSASSSVAAETSEAASTMAASTTAMPTTAASTTAESSVAQETSTPVETTTFATSIVATSSAVTTDSNGATTTEVATAVVTDVVTATHWHHWNSARHVASRRHVHG